MTARTPVVSAALTYHRGVLTRWWVRLAIVAAAYVVAGRLALLLAIPPGFATAIWPAAAIGVIAVARWGWSAALGVAVGSFGVNLSTGGWAIGAALALGPALQAMLAALLLRRALGGKLALERGRDVAKFYVLAGPVASLVAATGGMVVLYGSGAVAGEALAFNWFTWWIGDTVGVMFVAPIVLVLVGRPRTLWRARVVTVALPMTVVTIGMMAAYLTSSRYEQSRANTETGLRISAVANAIQQRTERYVSAIQSLASFLSANRTLGNDQFATFASGMFGRDADIQALAWAPRVTRDERAAFEAAARIEHGTFDIVERAPDVTAQHGLPPRFIRAGERDEYFPALYAEPPTRQRGFDLASETIRASVLQRARHSGEPMASQPLRLLQGEAGFLILAPVYTRDAEPTLLGVAVGAFSTNHLLESALEGLRGADVAIAITDITAMPIVVVAPPTTTARSDDARVLEIAGRTWRIDIVHVGAVVRSWQAWFAPVRLLIVGLLGAILLAITGGRRRIAAAEARNVEVERRNVEELQLAERDHSFQLELGDVLHGSESVRAVLQRSAIRIAEYLDLDSCHFAEIDVDDAQVVLHKYTRGKKRDADETVPLASFEIAGLGDLVKGTRYVIPDLTLDERTAELYETAYAPRAIRAFIAIPLMRGGVCVAYFSAISAEPREWTHRDVSLVQSVAERTWLWAEHLRSLHGLRANEQQLRELSKALEERVVERTQELVRAVGEREALLKEIHHRVKNNLQVISSMLNLQARRITDSRFKDVFDESQQRIQTIALVHERLYQSRDQSSIGFDEYRKSLVANVMSAQNAAARNVTATTEVDGVALAIQRAIPCGLIVNELVTNSLKHAFPNGRAGSIVVTMKPDGGHVELRVADDGVGLPGSLDPSRAKTLGLDLVYTFAEQLDATIDVSSSASGAAFTLRFPVA